MNQIQPFQADNLIESGDGFSIRSFIAYIIPGCEDMTGVQANTDSLFTLDFFQDFGQLLESMPQAGSLTGGGLQQQPRIHLR